MNLNKLISTHLLKRSALSYALYPLGLLYAVLQSKRRNYYSARAYHAPCKVISIGNIVSGGSGKTPLTISLAKMLQGNGLRVAVSHRGYKGEFEHKPSIISGSKGLLYTAEQTGDEAWMIASALPEIPVSVGHNRKSAIRLLLKSYPATDVIILDDAMQHVKVARDVEIVSFTAETGLGNGFVLPAGYLRESLKALNKHSIVIVYRKQRQQLEMSWLNTLGQVGCQVFTSSSKPVCCLDVKGNVYPLESLKGKRLVLVSGIAHPASFAASVSDLGLVHSRHYIYPDHYDYNAPGLVTNLNSEMPELILCTQKDIMKLARFHEIAPRLRALVLDYQFDEPEMFRDAILQQIGLPPR